MTQTVTMTLTEFLLARIAEDEADAVLADGVTDKREDDWQDVTQPLTVADTLKRESWAKKYGFAYQHIARHDPARVLADVKAKRAIVELASAHRKRSKRAWKEYSRWVEGKPVPEPGTPSFASDGDVQIAYDITLRHLASVYSDHPDYDEAWRA